jgi:hypothetical protein
VVIACDDCPETYLEATKFAQADKIHVLGPSLDGRLYALRNIDRAIDYIKGIDKYWVRSYVAIIDGDDQLCNPETLKLLDFEYGWNPDVVWTAHRWDNGHGNISEGLPDNVNPYDYRWVSSHLKTFGLWLYHQVNQDNFKDENGQWFPRCYDQALMLPLLSMAKSTRYIPKICYQYNIDSCSMPPKERTDGQYQTAISHYIRKRGLIR